MVSVPAVPQTALEAAGAVVTSTSLTLTDPDLPWDVYEQLGAFIGEMNRACSWWVGDLIVFGEKVYGETYAQIEQAIGLAPQTIANRASVARHIPPERRIPGLAFGTHAEVAYLPPRERDRWLRLADKSGWTRAKLREEMRVARGEELSPVGDLAVTGKSDSESQGTPLGVPAAAVRDHLGEPVPGSAHTCPACGHSFQDGEE